MDTGQDATGDPREALERMLLDGPRRWTRLQVAEQAGVPQERGRRLWRALGFADVADDDPAFADADVAALRTLSSLIDSGFVGPGTEAMIARAMGQALSRLADWQTDMLADALGGTVGETGGEAAGTRAATQEEVVAAAEVLLPRLQAIQDYVWRRH